MASFFLIQNYTAYTQKFPVALSGARPRCVLADLNEDQKADLIQQGIISPTEVQDYSPEDRSLFLERYTHMIALLNKDYQSSLLWWATDLSSKNRCNCMAPVYIQELMEIVALISRHPNQPLLVVDISPAVIASLEKHLRSKEMVFISNSLPVVNRLKVSVQRFKKMGAVFWYALEMYWKSVLARAMLKKYAEDQLTGKKEFYVIKTFSYDSSFDDQGGYKDVFFGRLPEDLNAHTHVLLLVNVLGDYRKFLRRVPGNVRFPIVPVEFFLRGGDACRAVAKVLKFRVYLSRPVLFADLDVTSIIQYELNRSFQGIEIQQFLHYDCTRRLLERIQVGTFLMTYENNPWERMCTLAVRRYSPSTKVMGYQHSVVPQSALNMFLHPSESGIVPLPDKILTVGEITSEMLCRCGHYPSSMVHTAVALRYEYLADVEIQTPPWRGNLLVALDGVRQCSQLLDYVLRQCRHMQMRVVIRDHPVLPRPYWQKQYDRQMVRLPHVQWSRQSLAQDLQWADALLYWQTTVVWEALKRGCPVIYFTTNDILSFDPLMDFHYLRWKVSGDQSLAVALEEIRHLSNEEKMEGFRRVHEMIQRYFYPVRGQYVRTFLS